MNKKRKDSKNYRFNIPSIIGLSITALLADPKFLQAIDSRWYILLMIVGAVVNVAIRDRTGVPIEGTEMDRKLNPIDLAIAEEDEEKGMM